mmetsp:Transcript_73/g.369  ORF Transcript_73/g.369 Transcript_73/m.369 type:complete len:280 (-) Transcript_73:159-998(-)
MGACWACSSCCGGKRYDEGLSDKLIEDKVPPNADILVLTLKKAENLMAADLGGSSDPYIVFRLGETKFASSRKVATLNPVWEPEETFRFLVDKPEEPDPVIVSVYDHDIVGDDDSLGDALIHLAKHRGKGRTETTLRLINPVNGKAECGTITLDIFLTTKDKAFAERIDDLYEYEQYQRLHMAWTSDFPSHKSSEKGPAHWSTVDSGRTEWSNSMDDLVDELPKGYVVASDWAYMMTHGDSDGWTYASSMSLGVWYDEQQHSSVYRRRRWRRIVRRRGC